MVEKRACVRCGADLETPATGRPPAYCSTACRRAAEYELRRLDRKLERLEEQRDRLPPVGHKRYGTHPYAGRTLEEHRAYLTELIAAAEARMTLLCST